MKYPQNYVVMDFETSGFSAVKNQITQIGVVIVNQEMEVILEWGEYSQRYDNRFLDPKALNFTGTKVEDLDTKGIPIQDIYATLVDIGKQFKEGRYAKPILVGHNFCEFDYPFLEDIFRINNDSPFKYFSRVMIDTMEQARRLWGLEEKENYQLGTVCKELGIDLIDGHEALNDARATAEAFIKLTKIFREGTLGGDIAPVFGGREKSRTKFLF